MVRYIEQNEAIKIDEELFTTYKFSVAQLMELAGLGCASAIYKCYPLETYEAICVVCGPGNNGGDGLVCARHLKLFGYKPVVYYPRHNLAPHIHDLMTQCQAMDVCFHDYLPNFNHFDLVVDALFGFSYKPPMRVEFQSVIDQFCSTTTQICSIDVPSGWNVNTGPIDGIRNFSPDSLISLTAPKMCAGSFCGRFHFLAGRFVPPILASLYDLRLPLFPNADPCIDITSWEKHSLPI